MLWIRPLVASLTVFAALAANGRVQAQADYQKDEQAIRALSQQAAREYSRTGHRARDLYAPDAVWVSGRYPRPIVGRDTTVQPVAEAQAEKRKNEKLTETIRRLEVSKAGDMAWEYADFPLSYDDANTGKHVEFPGSTLRVWRKVGGKWRIAASFSRPNEQD